MTLTTVEGRIEWVHDNGLVEGWARDFTGAPCHAQIRSAGLIVAEDIANEFRHDLFDRGIGHGHYGFRARLLGLPPGEHPLALYDGQRGNPIGGGEEVRYVIPSSQNDTLPVEALLRRRSRWSDADVARNLRNLQLSRNLERLGPARFIDRVYKYVLGRWADPNGLSRYGDALIAGDLTPEDFFRILLASEEGQRRGAPLASIDEYGFPFEMIEEPAPHRDARPAPVAIICSGDPERLPAFCESLSLQQGQIPEPREVHLFIDGAVNRYSGLRHASDADIATAIQAFHRHFPAGHLHASPDNVGLCETYLRAEDHLFGAHGFDCVYFLESDLVLSAAYIAMLDTLRFCIEHSTRVACFAATGDYALPPEQFSEQRRHWRPMGHRSGYAMLRRHWQAIRGQMADYLAIVRGQDYAWRDHRAIFTLYAAQDVAANQTSIDAALALACDRLGLLRCETIVPFAYPVELLPDPPAIETLAIADVELPLDSRLAELFAEQRGRFEQIYRDEFPALLARAAARAFSPMRLSTRDEVIYAHRLFQGRDPASETDIAEMSGAMPVIRVVEKLWRSRAFRSTRNPNIQRLCDREDVLFGYRLCLHRDPETDAIAAQHIGRTRVQEFMRGLVESEEFVGHLRRFGDA